MSKRCHGTAVALAGRGLLLRGPSGSGKSDLALRLIEQGWQLIADDQTEVNNQEGRLIARAPETIEGMIEVRGLGLVGLPSAGPTPLALLVDLKPAAEVERLPEPEWETLEGVALPRLALDPFALSAPAKLRLALAQLGNGEKTHEPARVVLVTGMSGAGRSTALGILEDLGYEAINNLPLTLLETLLAGATGERPVAIGVDIRTRDFAPGRLLQLFDGLAADRRLSVKLLFLECDDAALQRRFTETRRRHPLAQERPILDGIVLERRLLEPLKQRADVLLDTSQTTPGDFRRLLAGHFTLARGLGMMTFVTSFSYRQGLPREADLVIDVRFLSNPHYQAALRPLSGLDAPVADYVAADPDFAAFFADLTRWLMPLLPRYEREGKSYLTLAVGCTGGRHRSVMVAERLGRWLQAAGRSVSVSHRDLVTKAEPMG